MEEDVKKMGLSRPGSEGRDGGGDFEEELYKAIIKAGRCNLAKSGVKISKALIC